MSKGLSDKLFFINKLKELDLLVDFGCADGQLLNYISKVDDTKLIGYDLDTKMINISKKKYPTIHFTDNWNDVEELIKNNETNGILLSSIIHEVYSYSDKKTIDYFWDKQIFNPNFDYVIIRDMIPLDNYNNINTKDDDINKIREKSNSIKLKEFENIWGSIETNYKTMLHWLLKYRYEINWNREVKENYLPLSIESLKNKIPPGWDIVFEEHYTYYFIKDQIKKDYDIDITLPTHLKIIIKNNN